MQYISIQLEDEKSNIIELLQINFVHIYEDFLKIKNCEIEYPFLYYIDPYGYTIFNRIQVKRLINELERVGKDLKNKSLKIDISKILVLCKSVKIHQYIRFIGD